MTKNYTLWFTGLSGAGKTTLANEIFNFLKKYSHIQLIDGDIYRGLMCDKLGYSKEHRNFNVNSIGILSYYLNINNINTIVASISPYNTIRKFNKELINKSGNRYFQIYCECDIDILKHRDTKKLYTEKNIHLTGIDDPYEIPEDADVIVNTGLHSIETCVQNILISLINNNIIKAVDGFMI